MVYNSLNEAFDNTNRIKCFLFGKKSKITLLEYLRDIKSTL